jgi:hypothetical protein
MGAQKNFIYFAGWISECWDKDNTVFNEEYFRRAVVKTILFRSVEKLVPEQSWYQGGYRAQLVAYTNAKLSSMIQCAGTRELNYAAIWSRLAISPALHQQLKAIATAIFEPITNPPVGFHDVGEWCKKEQCWKRVLDLPIDLHGEFIAELTGRNSDRRSRAEARTQQDLDNSIGAQIKVVELGRGYWLQLAAWARARRLVTDEQNKLLSLVCQLPKKIPTDWQSEKLLQLKLKMEEEGFPSP